MPAEWRQLPSLPDPLGVAAPFAGTSGGALLVAGGANFPDGPPWQGGQKQWHDRVWILESPASAWRQAGSLPRPLAYGLSATDDEGLICAGGSDADRHYAGVFRLVWTQGAVEIQPLPPLPIPLAAACGAVVNGVLMVSCGNEAPGEQSATARTFALTLTEPAAGWRELEPLPGRPRFLATAAAADGAFFVLGGTGLANDAAGKIVRQPLRDAWSYHPDRGWTRLADLPSPNLAAPSPAPVVKDRLFLLAGDDGSLAGFTPVASHPGFPKTILTYHLRQNQWNRAGTTPAPRVTVPCVEWRGRHVIPSGEVRPGVRSPEVWSLHIPQ